MTRGLWIAGAILIIAYAIVPVFWIVSLSFKEGDDITNNSFLPTVWSWENYRTVFASDLFTTALRNSIGMSLIATTISVFLATLAAYAISRLDFPGKRLVLGVALAITVFPVIAIATPLFNLWRTLGLYDTWLGLIIPYLSYSLPLAVYVLAAFFREIPWEMEQAAQVDGATSWQAFRRVIVPLATPGVFTAAILTFFAVWNDFVFGITLTSSESARPVPAALAFFQGASQFSQPTAPIAAAAVVVTIPVVILVLLFQRKIVAGLTNGAVKG
ncbi:carbohydrate ABC transporter permease [Actinoplanes subglobosus]|uniref:Carbohydrate ABC transporter permease n=1 Tax=Actinoplanes subglobosus TaxID=1547892 RepID=A0ABV8J2K8_9ACTN